MSKKRQYPTDEFRREAVRMLESSGKSVPELARELGISEKSLYRWRKQYGSSKQSSPTEAKPDVVAERRRKQLAAERQAAEAQRQQDIAAQAQRARDNAAMNAKMRADAQQEVVLAVKVSDVYKQWQAHIAALMAEYHFRMERGQRILAAHAVHEQVQALVNSVGSAMNQYGGFMTADEIAQLQAQIDAYNTSFSDFQPDAMIEQVQGLNELYAPIIANVQSRYESWKSNKLAQAIEEQRRHQRIEAISILGEMNDGNLDISWGNQSAESLEQKLIAELPHGITRIWGGQLSSINVCDLDLETMKQVYYTLRDTQDELLVFAGDSLSYTSILMIAQETQEDNINYFRSQYHFASTNSDFTPGIGGGAYITEDHKEILNRAFALAVAESIGDSDSTIWLDYYQAVIENAFWVTFEVEDGTFGTGQINPTTGLYDGTGQSADAWNLLDVHFVRKGIETTADAFGIWANNVSELDINVDAFDLYRRVMGPVAFIHENQSMLHFGQSTDDGIVVFRRPSRTNYYFWTEGDIVYSQKVSAGIPTYRTGSNAGLPVPENNPANGVTGFTVKERAEFSGVAAYGTAEFNENSQQLLDDGTYGQAILTPNNVIHELGHRFNYLAGIGNIDHTGSHNSGNLNDLAIDAGLNSRIGMGYPDPSILADSDLYHQIDYRSPAWTQDPDTAPDTLSADFEKHDSNIASRYSSHVDVLQHSSVLSTNEYVADAFLNWVLDLATSNHNYTEDEVNYDLRGFTHDADGERWRNFMNDNMPAWMRNALLYQMGEEQRLVYLGEVGLLPQHEIQGTAIPNSDVVRMRSGPGSNNSFVAYAPTDGINIVGQTTGTDNWIWYAIQYYNQTLWVRSDLLNTFITLNNQPLDLATLPTIDPDAGFSGNAEFSNAEWEIKLIQGSGIFGGQVV